MSRSSLITVAGASVGLVIAALIVRQLLATPDARSDTKEDEIARALSTCVATLDNAGRSAAASAIRAEMGKRPAHELLARCARVQQEPPSAGQAPSAASASATKKKPCFTPICE